MKRLHSASAVILGAVLACNILSIQAAIALQPPTQEQVMDMKQKGIYDKAIQRAYELGNNEISPALVEKLSAQQLSSVPGLKPLAFTRKVAWPHKRYGSIMPSTGTVRVPVVIIDFWDYPSKYSTRQYTEMLSGFGDSSNYPTESLRNYYLRSSYYKLDIVPEVLGVYHYPGYRSSINTNDGQAEQKLVQQAFKHFDRRTNFARYDSDSDKVVEYPIVIWSGPSGEWSSFWWGHWGVRGDSKFELDGRTLGPWSWQQESLCAQTVIHETGHALGLEDLYDYDDKVGVDGGVGWWDPMSANAGDHNAFSKWMLGWLRPTVVSTGTKNVTLRPLSVRADALIVAPNFTLSNPFQEFYLVEARKRTYNDEVNGFPEESKLLIWHVDARLVNGGGWAWNNSYTKHKFMRVMEADGLEHIETWDFRYVEPHDTDLYGPGQRFSINTRPSSRFYDQSIPTITIKNIYRDGARVSFSAGIGTAMTIRFDSNGGSKIPNRLVRPGSEIGTLPTPSRRGYIFAGWYEKAGGIRVSRGEIVQSNLALIARWQSTNSNLAKLSATTGVWSNKFSSSRNSYKLIIASNRTGTKVVARKAHVGARVSWSYDRVRWHSGAVKKVSVARGKYKNLYFRVVAQSGAKKMYKVRIYRKR